MMPKHNGKAIGEVLRGDIIKKPLLTPPKWENNAQPSHDVSSCQFSNLTNWMSEVYVSWYLFFGI